MISCDHGLFYTIYGPTTQLFQKVQGISTEAGVAISLALAVARKQTIQTPYQRLPPLMLSALATISTKSRRFLEALKTLESKMVDGQIVVERVNQKFAELSFCKKSEPSALGSIRYHEILKNLGENTSTQLKI